MNRASTLAVALLALALLQAGAHAQSPAVQQLYQQAHAEQQAEQTDKAIATYRELLRKDPSIAPAYNNLGRLLFTSGRFPEAIEVLRKGLALNQDMVPAQIMLGASYLEVGDAARAVEPLERGVKGMPEDHFARQSLAQALMQTHRSAEAVNQLQELVKLDPSDQRNWYLLGKLELQLAQEDFAHMRSIDVNSPLSHQLSGEVMESMQNTPGAVTEYKQALALDPSDTEALHHLADLYWSTGDWAAAKPALTSYLEKRPGDCQAESKLANTLSQLGADNAEVLSHASAAVKACPDLAQAHVERARALLKENKPAEALTDLKFSEAKSPDEPSVQFLLARAYHALGDEALAKTAMARFQELDKAEHTAKEKHAAEVLSANP